MSLEDRDLHSDLVAAYRQIEHQAGVIGMQADLIAALLDRRRSDRRTEPGGLGSAIGLDRRESDRRG